MWNYCNFLNFLKRDSCRYVTENEVINSLELGVNTYDKEFLNDNNKSDVNRAVWKSKTQVT